MSGDWADLAARIIPIVIFLLAITVTAELADRAGVFDVAGHALARVAGRRVWVLWLIFAALATLCTIALSLDTTAVLLTPVGLAIAKAIGAPPLPFALTTLWVANTGSLLLPVSNLTNLLAAKPFAAQGISHGGYISLAAAPAAVAVLVTLVCIAGLRWRDLKGRYAVAPPAQAHDVVLLRLAAVVCVVVGPLFAAGLSPALVASGAAAVLIVATRVRQRESLLGLAIPWRMALGFSAMSAAVTWLHGHGLASLMSSLAGQGEGPLALLRLAATGAGAANVVNNLPAYLALEPTGDSPMRLMALLVGVNAGPLITPWASLATLLWLARLRSAGVRLPAGRLAAAGALCAVATVTASTVTLAVIH